MDAELVEAFSAAARSDRLSSEAQWRLLWMSYSGRIAQEKLDKEKRMISSDDEEVIKYVNDLKKAAINGTKACSAIAFANLRLALHNLKRYTDTTNPVSDKQDMFQSAYFGILRAAEKFLPLKGFEFSTYCMHWIQQSTNESRKKIGLIDYHSGAGIQVTSMDAPVKTGEVDTQHETIQGDWMEDPDDKTGSGSIEATDVVGKAMKKLLPVERRIVKLYFGLDPEAKDYDVMTFKIVGGIVGISAEVCRRTFNGALEKMKNYCVNVLGVDAKDFQFTMPEEDY